MFSVQLAHEKHKGFCFLSFGFLSFGEGWDEEQKNPNFHSGFLRTNKLSL